jgi:poly(A) polymerase
MIIVNADLELLLDSNALSLLTWLENYLSRQKVHAYVVGGFVRDRLLERETADIDIALMADALDIAPGIASALGGRYVLLDSENRIGRVILAEEDSSRSWQIDFSTVRDSIEKDLGKRDFTIDAIAIGLDKLTKGTEETPFIDPFGGLKDIPDRVIRAVGPETFEQDPARLLRAVRLATELGFAISQETAELIQRSSHLVSTVAGERAREELLRLLAITDGVKLWLYLDDLGLLTALIPELGETKGVEQPGEHQWDVFHHSVKAIDAVDFVLRRGNWQYADGKVLNYVPWSAELARHFELKVSGGSNRRLLVKLAALLHDIAKPQTKSTSPEGRTRFLGHAREGAPVAAAILERLRFSTKEIKLVEAVVRYHLRPAQMSRDELPTPRAAYRYFRDAGDAAIDTLFFSLADHLATRGPDLDLAHWQQHTDVVKYALNQHFGRERVTAPPKLVSGHDLMEKFNLSPGPRIGQLLEAVREAQAAGEVSSQEEALSYAARLVASERENPSDS